MGASDLSQLPSLVQIPMVRKVILHPDYNPRTEANDIALIELDRPVTFNDYVQPACLPHVTKDSKTSFKNCYISGWGTTAQNSEGAGAGAGVDGGMDGVGVMVCTNTAVEMHARQEQRKELWKIYEVLFGL